MAIDFTESYPVLTWDLNKRNLFFKYFGKKSDSARGIKVQLIQDSVIVVPSTESVRFYCVKPDNTKVYLDAIIDEGYFVVHFTPQVFAVKGMVSCELQLHSNGRWISSETFGISVSDNLADGTVIVSTDDFLALQNALEKVDTLEQTYATRLTAVETGKIDKESIANNLVTTASGMVLDARQGRELKNQIDTINNKFDTYQIPNYTISNQTEFDAYVNTGVNSPLDNNSIYRRRLYLSSPINVANDALGGSWILEGFKASSSHQWQKLTGYFGKYVYFRVCNSGIWSEWKSPTWI